MIQNKNILTFFILSLILLLSGCSLSNEEVKEKIISKMTMNDNYKLTYDIKFSEHEESSYLVMMKSGDIKKTQFETIGITGFSSTILTEYQKGEQSVFCMKTIINTDDLIKSISGEENISEKDEEFISSMFSNEIDIGFCSPYDSNGKDVVTTILFGSFLNEEEIVITKKEINNKKVYCGSQTTTGNIFEYKEDIKNYTTYNEICINSDTAFVETMHSQVKDGENNEIISDVTMNLIKEEEINQNNITNNRKFIMENFECKKDEVSFDIFSLSDFNNADLVINKTQIGDSNVVYSGKENIDFFENKSLTLALDKPIVGSVGVKICLNGVCERGFCQVKKECMDQDIKKWQEKRNRKDSPEWVKSYAELNGEKLEDSCINQNMLAEAMCSENDTLVFEEFECECGCNNGVCGYQPEIYFTFEKRILTENYEKEDLVTWQIKPIASNPNEDEDINLKEVKLWVTKNPDPNNITDLKQTLTINKILKPKENFESDTWEFEYTSGWGSEYPPPIVWIKPSYCGIYD